MLRAGALGIVLLLFATGCAWRTAHSERYFGPVFHRTIAAADGEAAVRQTRHLGFLLEVGRQWGLTVGFADRVAAAPAEIAGGASSGERWSTLGSPPFGSWFFSPLYLVGRRLPAPRFLARTVLGVRVGYGEEARSLSVGYARTTEVRPPHDALYALDYDASDPLAMRFHVWHDRPGHQPPVQVILKEDIP